MRKNFFYKLKLIFFPCQDNKYRPKLLDGNFLFYYGLVLLILKLIIIPFLFSLPETPFFASITKTGLFELSNYARMNLGISPLKENPVLNTAAYLKARHMMENDYFAHYSPDGISPWHWLKISGYNYKMAGENLAIGFLKSEQAHLAWMESYSHKRNILNPNFREMGIAVVRDYFQDRETTLVVQFFGTQRPIIPTRPAPVISMPRDVQPTPEVINEAEIKEKEPVVLPTDPIIPKEEPAPLVVSEEKLEEAFALAVAQDAKRTPILALFQFMTTGYYDLIQNIIYGSLALIIIVLLLTIFYDIFIYRKFEINYKDAIFKAVSFSALWFILVFLDKMIMIELVNPQNFMIY